MYLGLGCKTPRQSWAPALAIFKKESWHRSIWQLVMRWRMWGLHGTLKVAWKSWGPLSTSTLSLHAFSIVEQAGKKDGWSGKWRRESGRTAIASSLGALYLSSCNPVHIHLGPLLRTYSKERQVSVKVWGCVDAASIPQPHCQLLLLVGGCYCSYTPLGKPLCLSIHSKCLWIRTNSSRMFQSLKLQCTHTWK